MLSGFCHGVLIVLVAVGDCCLYACLDPSAPLSLHAFSPAVDDRNPVMFGGFVRPKLMSRPMLSSCPMSSLITDLEDEALRFTVDIPGPTLLELEGGPRSSRSVRDVEGGGLCDLVRLLDRARDGGGFRLVERARRVVDVEGGRLVDRAGGRWCKEL